MFGKGVLCFPSNPIYHNLTEACSVRYAAPPVGKLRWQAPQVPAVNRSHVIQANAQPPLCPQSGAAKTPDIYGFLSGPGDEDCLFLNVYAPPGARNLPVFFWIRTIHPLSCAIGLY